MRLFGAAEILLDGRRLRAFDSLRLQRFLALLVLRRDLRHRSQLAFQLWPDSSERQARTNLRKLLHEFRHSLPETARFVEIDNQTVQWLRDGPSDVDVLRFREALAAGDLELAVRLYDGDLLPAYYDDWILEERAQLRSQAREALVRLMEAAVRRGDHEAAIGEAGRILDLEPTDEGAARVRMEAHLALCDKTAALRCYHQYAEALQRELTVAPGEAVQAIYRRLRTGTTDDADRSDGPTRPTEAPFVGRDLELERLEAAWRGAQQHGPHLVLVTGEPGIGKTRLASELGRRVRAQGHAVAAARAYEAAGRLPWGPIVDLLRSDALRRRIDTLDTRSRAELARLLPELYDDSTTSGPGRPEGRTQRHRLFDAVSRALLVDDRPRLLIIDDLQWCDAETVELIGLVVRSEATAPLLVVGTLRSEEVPAHHPLHELAGTPGGGRAVTTLALERLDETATAALAARLSGRQSIAPELAKRLWSETEGNPLFVIEALRAGLSADGGPAPLTPTMRAVLSTRLDQLSDSARHFADAAAVVGRPFSVALMAEVTGTAKSELADPIDELWRRGIIRDLGLSYDFSHDTLRAVALERVGPARRRRLHRAVAEAIAAEFHDDLDATAPRLAAHYDQAGMAGPAIDAYRAAGARAAAVSALEEAVSLLQRALVLLAEAPPTADRDAMELDLRITLGSPLVALEGYGSRAAHRLYERAVALCGKLERAVDPPILRGLGLARLQGCCFDDCDELARTLLAGDTRDPITRTEGRYLLGVSAFWRGDLATARHHLDGAIDAYDVARRDEHLALYAQDPRTVCLIRLAWIELWSGDSARADETARTALDQAVELDHLMTLGYVVTYAVIVAAEAEDLSRLAELLEQADLLWERFSDRYLMVIVEALRAWLDVCEDSLAGIEEIVRAVERSRSEGETLHLSYALLLLARARLRAGELDRGRAAAREGLSWSSRSNQRYLEAELWRVDGELAFRGGEVDAASESLRHAVETAAAQGAGWLELRALNSLASRFPDPTVLERLGDLVETLPSGHGLPPLRAAKTILTDSK